MNSKIISLINLQINREMYSAYLYLSFASYYAEQGLSGFENWYRIQAKEEMDHAMMFFDYLHNNSVNVELEAIAKPDIVPTNLLEPLKASLAHEQFVTDSINNIYAVALEEKDYRTKQLLDWFIKEQGEEEKNANDMISKYELFGQDPKGLYLLNNELATRTYTPATLVL